MLLNYLQRMLKACSFSFLISNLVLSKVFIMKYVTYIIITIAIALIVVNVLKLDFDNLFKGDSVVALICIVALLCAICILLIFNMSKSIDEKSK